MVVKSSKFFQYYAAPFHSALIEASARYAGTVMADIGVSHNNKRFQVHSPGIGWVGAERMTQGCVSVVSLFWWVGFPI